MIEQLSTPTDKVLGFTMSGKLHDEDYQKFVPVIDAAVAKHGKIRLLARFHDFHGWDLHALWDDIKFSRLIAPRSTGSAGRRQDLGKWMAKVCKPFTMAAIRYFDATDIDAAWTGSGSLRNHTKEIRVLPRGLDTAMSGLRGKSTWSCWSLWFCFSLSHHCSPAALAEADTRPAYYALFSAAFSLSSRKAIVACSCSGFRHLWRTGRVTHFRIAAGSSRHVPARPGALFLCLVVALVLHSIYSEQRVSADGICAPFAAIC